MPDTAAETPQAAMKRVAEDGARRLQEMCETNQTGGSTVPKEASVWEHACLLDKKAAPEDGEDPDRAKCATVMLEALEDEPGKEYKSEAAANAILAALQAATPADEADLKHPKLGIDSRWRAAARSFVVIARGLAKEEALGRLEATRPSPVRPFPHLGSGGGGGGDAGGGGGATPGGGGGGTNVVVQPAKNAEERKDDRHNAMGSWLGKHTPKAAHRAHTYRPAREACLEFPEYKVAGSVPTIPKLDAVVKHGGAQDVLEGRDDPLADLKRALCAAQKAHAVPCPEGVAARAEDGPERLTVKIADSAAANGARTVSLPPVLSATAVDEAIEMADGALHPLTREQKAHYSKKAWNEFITAAGASEQVGHPLTGALRKAWSRPWLEEASTVARRGDTPSNKRSRDATGKGPKDGAKKGRKDPKGKNKPTCESWRASGECANHAAGQCAGLHHPKAWAGKGEP